MAKLNPELKQAIEKADLYPLATASSSGLPNVIPIKFVFIENDNELWLVDNFMQKTLQNLQENPQASLGVTIFEAETAVQIKGDISIHTDGDEYQRMRDTVLAIKADAPAKSLIKLKISEIYQCWPGNSIGQRLDD